MRHVGRKKEESICNPEDLRIQFFDLFTEIPASLNQKWCRKRVLELPGLRIKPYIKHAQAHTCCRASEDAHKHIQMAAICFGMFDQRRSAFEIKRQHCFNRTSSICHS